MLKLSDIVGQDAAVAQLERAMGSHRMPHAYLFAGPLGVGRRTTAVALAQLLLCEKPATAGGQRQACGACADCRMMAANTHTDFHLIYKELARYHDNPKVRDRVMQELGIDVILDFLIVPANRAAARGRGKVFVVREAELMSTAAQNALLKTLEEPPPGVTIILLAERPEQLLATTVSRCHVVRFGPLPRQFVESKLQEQSIPAEEARFWAAFTHGSIGRSASLARQGLYAIKREMIQQLAAMPPAGDADLGERFAKTMDALAEESVKLAKREQGAELSKNLAARQAAGAMIEIIASAFQDALRLAAGDEGKDIVHSDQAQDIAALARRFDTDSLATVIEQLSEYEELLWRNLNPKIVWDNLIATCATAAPLRAGDM